MKTIERLSYLFGSILLWLLFIIGALVAALIAPAISEFLTRTYSEYANDRLVIQLLLTTPVALGMLIVLTVLLLVRLVHKNQIMSNNAYKWVKALTLTTFGLAVSLLAIILWLNSKNTLPPLVGAALVSGTLLALAVGFVTLTLASLLKRATTNVEELEGVI
jgi:MFS family permease